MKKADALAVLSALAHEKRFDVYGLLVKAGPSGLRPGQIDEKLGMSQTALSFHLKELRIAGLVTFTRHAQQLTYVAEHPPIQGLLTYLVENRWGSSTVPSELVSQSEGDTELA